GARRRRRRIECIASARRYEYADAGGGADERLGLNAQRARHASRPWNSELLNQLTASSWTYPASCPWYPAWPWCPSSCPCRSRPEQAPEPLQAWWYRWKRCSTWS